MKVEITKAHISDEMGLVATVEVVDEAAVRVEIKQIVGWISWIDLTDAVRRVMMMMDICDSPGVPVPSVERSGKYRTKKAREEERLACAQVCEQMGAEGYGALAIAAAIRGRTGND